MRILLDQNVPFGVRRFLTGHEVETAFRMGWGEFSNGELLSLAEASGFDVLVTCDQNLTYQQNLSGMVIRVAVLWSGSWPVLRIDPDRVRALVTG